MLTASGMDVFCPDLQKFWTTEKILPAVFTCCRVLERALFRKFPISTGRTSQLKPRKSLNLHFFIRNWFIRNYTLDQSIFQNFVQKIIKLPIKN